MKNSINHSTTEVRTIEEEINQTRPFQSVFQKASVNLLYTFNCMIEQIRAQLDPYGITIQQYNVLRILRGANGPLTTSVIRERMLDRMSDTSRLVDRLVKKELASRSICPNDRRLVDVSITDAGRKLLADLDDSMATTHQYSEVFGEKEAKQLSNLLDRLRASVQPIT